LQQQQQQSCSLAVQEAVVSATDRGKSQVLHAGLALSYAFCETGCVQA
jgi:hypothetical protein